MADNLVIDEGTSAKSARTDEVTANVHVPFVKLMDGTTDGTTVAAVGANGLACDVKNASIAGTAGTANAGVLSVQGIASMTPVQAQLVAGTASIGKLTDDQKMDINKIAGASVPVSGGTEATCMRVTLPTDGTGQVKLAASTAAIGKLAANDGVDIGNVDVASLPALVAGSALIGKVSIDQATANANEIVLKAGTAAFGKLAANSGVDIGDVDVLSLPALAVSGCIQWSHYSNEYTTAQTSTDLVAANSTNKFYIGRITIGTGGTTAGLVTVYFGTGAYAAGTNKTVFRGNFAPSATAYPGVVIGDGGAPFCISAASDALKITTSAGITVYVQVDYIRV